MSDAFHNGLWFSVRPQSPDIERLRDKRALLEIQQPPLCVYRVGSLADDRGRRGA